MPHHIFLSYSRKDTPTMQRICDDLRAAGLSVWTDAGIEPGTPLWKDSIELAIEEAGCLVVILSPDSKHSQWVKRELEYADSQSKPIFPVLARGDESDAIPFLLIGAQFVDIQAHYTAGVQVLISTVRERLNGEPVPINNPPRHMPPPHGIQTGSYARLNPWNFLDQFQLLRWLFLDPGALAAYLHRDGDETVRRTGAWIVSGLGWMPFLLPLLGYTIGTVEIRGQRPITLLFAYTLFLIGWIAAGVLGGGKTRDGVFSLVITGFIAFMIYVLVRGVSGIEFIPNDVRGQIGTIFVGITIGVAAGIAFCTAYTATGTLAGLVIAVTLFAGLFRIFPGTASAVAGLLMVGLAFFTATVLNKGLQTGCTSVGHYIIIGVNGLAYTVALWLYLLGGWQVLGG